MLYALQVFCHSHNFPKGTVAAHALNIFLDSGQHFFLLTKSLLRREPEAIALFTVNFCHLHYYAFKRGCEAISGNFAVTARKLPHIQVQTVSGQNCLTSTFRYIVMQVRKVNCEKGFKISRTNKIIGLVSWYATKNYVSY